MSTGKLYQEALDEAKGLVQMAEENAKNKLIEAFAPRIRKLVEKSLLNEEDDSDESFEDILGAMTADEPEMDSLDEPVSAEEEEDFELDDDTDEEEMEDDEGISLQVPRGVKSVTFSLSEKDKDKILTDKMEESVNLDQESVSALLRIVDGQGTLAERAQALRLDLKIIGRALGALNEGRAQPTAALRIVEEFNSVLRKAIGLKQEIKDSVPGPLAEESKKVFNKLTEEIETMSTRSLLRNLLSEKRGGRLFEAEEAEVDAAELKDAVTKAVETLAGAAGMEVKPAEGADDEGGDEEGDEEMDLDMEEMDEVEEAMHEVEEAMHGEAYEADEADHSEMKESARRRRDVVYTIDESMLRGALRRLRENAADMAGHFGGGEDDGDAFEDPTELNALSEKDEPKEAKKSTEAKKAAEAKKKADEAKKDADEAKKEAVKEARMNRALRARLSEAAQAVKDLNRQLAEQKLFNAKLLYVNKLMQNRSITDKQIRSIVEALDSAKTIREAKLLFTSLSESLSRSGGTMTESAARTAGGSSRPTRSSSTLNESVGEMDRWQVLAGIANKK